MWTILKFWICFKKDKNMKEQLGIYCMSIIIHKNVNYSCWTIAITTFIHLCESIICKQSQRLFCWGGYWYLLVISFLDILPSLLTANPVDTFLSTSSLLPSAIKIDETTIVRIIDSKNMFFIFDISFHGSDWDISSLKSLWLSLRNPQTSL